MPASDLKALREYVANVLDYDPSNTVYARQIDNLLNEADREICASKPFTFVNKASDVTAYKDATATDATMVLGTRAFSTAAPLFLSWMVNQEIEIDSVIYTITNVTSTTVASLDRGFESANGVYTVNVMNRYLDLPAGCTTVLGVARRTNTRTPNSPGLLSPLTRYEDEWNNLPLGEVNLPVYWVYHDPAYINGPRKNLTAAAIGAGPGQGDRTVELTSTFVRGGRESPHGQIVSVAANDSEDVQLTPYSGVTNDGLYKRYYFRCTGLGYDAFRLLNDPTGGVMELAPTDVAARTLLDLDSTSLSGGESVYGTARMLNPDGFTQRIRLYPRQDQDYVFTIRYMEQHQVMREDNDVSSIPPEFRMTIAYKALSDIFIKHDNMPQSELYRRRFDELLLKLERRYLITPSRRIVKGNWLVNMEPNGFSRFTTLVHT
tara:strand:- start:1743 stop:3041 length:1299 start_codon:yes stop_codon:yes gene_type:complete